jgi:hypothetical protein
MSESRSTSSLAAPVLALHRRFAVVCDHPECNPRARSFFESVEAAEGWRCPDHGRGVRQVNRRYLGALTVAGPAALARREP